MGVLLRRAPKWIGWFCVFACTARAAGNAEVFVPIRGPASLARPDFRVESDLVLIPVSVTDARNHAVTSLCRESFRVFEDQAEQQIVQFAREDTPVAVGLVFDSSSSMTGKLSKSREAIRQFLRFANPEDEFFLVEFSSRPRLTVPFTGDAGRIQDRLLTLEPYGTTALLDAVGLAMHYLKSSRLPRRALLILSDGGDNHSRYTEREIRERVREADVWIYAMGIYEQRARNLPSADTGRRLLEALAEESGGRHFAVNSLADLPVVAARISLELRNQYILGYRPANSQGEGKYHHVQVRVVENGPWNLAWRPGYYEQ